MSLFGTGGVITKGAFITNPDSARHCGPDPQSPAITAIVGINFYKMCQNLINQPKTDVSG